MSAFLHNHVSKCDHAKNVCWSLSFQVIELVPESQAYMDLLAFENKLDSTIMRKKLDVQEALKRPLKVIPFWLMKSEAYLGILLNICDEAFRKKTQS